MRAIKLTLLVILSIATNKILLKLFPFTGLGAMVLIPVAFILSVALGVLHFFISKTIRSSILNGIFYLLTAILIFYVNLLLFPSSINRSPIPEFKKTFLVWGNYDQVKYSDIFLPSESVSFEHNQPLHTAALYKYKNYLPEKAFLVEYSEPDKIWPSKMYYLALRGDSISTNNQMLQAMSLNDSTLSEIHNGDTIVFPNPITNTAYNKEIASGMNRFCYQSAGNTCVRLEKINIKLSPERGLDKLFYDLLSKNKEPVQ